MASQTEASLAQRFPTGLPDGATVSVYAAWLGTDVPYEPGEPVGSGPVVTRDADVVHAAASTMKLPLMMAAYRAAEAGELDLDAPVRIVDELPSATGVPGERYVTTRDYDNDDEPWDRLGEEVSLRWLVRRAIVSSSNLATNLVIDRVGLPRINALMTELGCTRSVVGRGIQDTPAGQAGLANVVTAHDLARLLAALVDGRAGGPASRAEMLDVLHDQLFNDGIPAGLPEGIPVAHKTGWIDGVTHDAALVRPPDGPSAVLVVLTTVDLPEERADALIADVARGAWVDLQADLQADGTAS